MNTSDLQTLVEMIDRNPKHVSIMIHNVNHETLPKQFVYDCVSHDGKDMLFVYKPADFGSEIIVYCPAPIVTWYFNGMTTDKRGQPYEAKNEKHETPLPKMIQSLQDGLDQNWFDREHAVKVCNERGVDPKYLDCDFNKTLPF